MATNPREGYRERIAEGDVVYIVEGENTVGGGELTVKKATVRDAEPHRRYPFVQPWKELTEPPTGVGTMVSLSPRAMFTAQEIARLVRNHEGPLNCDPRHVDELIKDPEAHPELVIILGGAVMDRTIDDELRRPHDIEY